MPMYQKNLHTFAISKNNETKMILEFYLQQKNQIEYFLNILFQEYKLYDENNKKKKCTKDRINNTQK